MKTLVNISARRLLLALVALPLLVYGLYLALIAADRYVSESLVSVRQAGGEGAGVPGAALLLAGISASANGDTLILRDFVHSQALQERLEKRLGLKAHFAQAGLDWPLRLREGASREQQLRYFRDRVAVSHDERSGLLRVRVEGFDPGFAQKLNQAILDECERFVNESSHRIARDRLGFAEQEMQRASTHLAQARKEVLAFQSANRLLDPGVDAQASAVLVAELQAERAKLQAELKALRGFLNDSTHQVKALRARLQAADQQIDVERRRATSEQRDGALLSQQALDFQALRTKAEFAQDGYKLALVAVENARIDATRKVKSLVVVEPPSLAETAEYPRAFYNLGSLFAICLLLYAITRLVLVTIREHQD